MREFVKVSQTIWRSRKFRGLESDDCRYCYLYILTCPHATSAGCFDLHPMYACADLGWEIKRFRDCIDKLEIAGLITWDGLENTVHLSNWIEFNSPANPKHALGIISQLKSAPSQKLKMKAFHELRAEITARKFDREASVRNALQTFFEQYGDSIPTETETESKTETESRPDLDQTRPRCETSLSPDAALTGVGLRAQQEFPEIPEHLNRLLKPHLRQVRTA